MNPLFSLSSRDKVYGILQQHFDRPFLQLLGFCAKLVALRLARLNPLPGHMPNKEIYNDQKLLIFSSNLLLAMQLLLHQRHQPQAKGKHRSPFSSIWFYTEVGKQPAEAQRLKSNSVRPCRAEPTLEGTS